MPTLTICFPVYTILQSVSDKSQWSSRKQVSPYNQRYYYLGLQPNEALLSPFSHTHTHSSITLVSPTLVLHTTCPDEDIFSNRYSSGREWEFDLVLLFHKIEVGGKLKICKRSVWENWKHTKPTIPETDTPLDHFQEVAQTRVNSLKVPACFHAKEHCNLMSH